MDKQNIPSASPMSEKLPCYATSTGPVPTRASSSRRLAVIARWSLAAVSTILILSRLSPSVSPLQRTTANHDVLIDTDEDICAQVDPWTPPSSFPLPKGDDDRLIQLLSEAVQHDTTVPDEWGPLSNSSSDQIKKYYDDAFLPFAAWLEGAYPLVHEKLTKEVVDSHGLIYTWQGSDETLKPLLLMGHQDVVPVEPTTVDDWTHSPFSGFIDKENGLIWGRGASDDKASVIAILATLETLLGSDFAPQRTIVCSFGFDEESAGSAARALAAFLLDRYGHDGVAMVVDEGGGVESAEDSRYGVALASPSTAEKGYMDMKVIVETPGGHSSEPPERTGIGYLARIVAALEDEPPVAHLETLDHPAMRQFLCLRGSPAIRKRKGLSRALDQLANHSKGDKGKLWGSKSSMLQWFKRSPCPVAARRHQQRLFNDVLDNLSPQELNYFRTTQAVDLISGGIKINALPERAVATVNYRIDVYTKSWELQEQVGQVVKKKAEELGLVFKGWPSAQSAELVDIDEAETQSKAVGSVRLELLYPALEAAPRTPISGPEAGPFRLLSSVIRHTWREEEEEEKKDDTKSSASSSSSSSSSIPVYPDEMIGNTDTASYWSLTRHIFRFSGGSVQPVPKGPGLEGGIHTVNEAVQIDALIKGAEFYRNLIVAVQHAEM